MPVTDPKCVCLPKTAITVQPERHRHPQVPCGAPELHDELDDKLTLEEVGFMKVEQDAEYLHFQLKRVAGALSQ